MSNPNYANGGLVVGTLFLLAGIVLATVSIATNEWVELPTGKQGLWKSCPDAGSCYSINGVGRDLNAARSTMVIGDAFGGISLATAIGLLACLALRDIRGRWITPFIALFSFLAFAFTVIGIVVYHATIFDDYDDITDADHGYSFWLGVAAIIVFAIATAIFIVAIVMFESAYRRRKRREEKQMMVEREKHFVQPYYNAGMNPYVAAPRPVVYERSYDMYQGRHGRPRAVDYPVAAVPAYPMYRDYYSQDSLNLYNYGEPAIINPSASAYRYHSQERVPVHVSRGRHSSKRTKDPYGYPINYVRDA